MVRFVLPLAVVCACAQTPPFAEADEAMRRWHEKRGTPGLVYGIVMDGRLAHVRAFGLRDAVSKSAVEPDTVFRIASMTKSFTALAVLRLRDEGKLSLDDLVSKWIPEFAAMPPATRDAPPLRVRHLLTHTAGFPEDNPWGDQQLGESDATLDQWLRAGIPFSTAPGTSYEYSNYGFALAGRVVAKASGMPYRDYMEKHILAPLGMASTTLEPSVVPAGKRATGYRRSPRGEYSEEKQLAHGSFGAMGGMLTNAPDLARYVAFLLSAWPARDEEERGPVKRASVREMQMMAVNGDLSVTGNVTQGPLSVSTSGYGYGLRISRDCRFAHIVGHGGGLPGFGSYMTWLPEYGVGLFAMSNLTYAGPAGALNEVYDILRKNGTLKKRPIPASPAVIRARDTIYSLWQRWDDATASKAAANNLFLDTPAEARKREMERLKTRVGACKAPGDVEPENLLRGTFAMDCERGRIHATFTLAPTPVPTIQYLSFSETKPQGDNLCRP